MPEFIKAHAREYLMVFAAFLVLIQLIMPSTLDVLLDFVLIGCIYLGMMIGPKKK